VRKLFIFKALAASKLLC